MTDDLFVQPSTASAWKPPTFAQGSLLAELADILLTSQVNSARSLQKAIGPSEIGEPCDRALAYRLYQVPPVNPETLKWAPLVGTWGHAGIAEALLAENRRIGWTRFLVEGRVTVSEALGVTGQSDVYDAQAHEVVDWKFVGKTRLAHYRRKGPGPVYRTQAHLYGRGWQNAGMKPKSVRIVFLPRWSHLLEDGWEWSEPYQEHIALEALDRLGRIQHKVTAGVDIAQFIGRPGPDGCKYCKFYDPNRTDPPGAGGCPGADPEPAAFRCGMCGRDQEVAEWLACARCYLAGARTVDDLSNAWRVLHPLGLWTADLEKVGLKRREELLIY